MLLGLSCSWIDELNGREYDILLVCFVSPDRDKIRGDTLDYLRENRDYPCYPVHDRFRRAKEKSVRAVKRGEGKSLRQGRKKLPVYRDEAGR